MLLTGGSLPVPAGRATKSPLRKYPRVTVNFPAECAADGDIYRTRVLTLGGGGLLLRMPCEMPPDTELTVRFRPAKHLPKIEARARVRYQLADQATGIEFAEIKPEDRQMILRVIHRRFTEKREHPRRPFVAQVEHEAGTFLGFSRDISVGGMFIETKEPLPEGAEITLRFPLDDGGPVIVLTGQVRYIVEKVGMGVQFLDLSPADRSRIDVYVTRGESSFQSPQGNASTSGG